MENKLAIFNNQDFGQVRTVDIDGKVYFVAFDVAKALGYEKERNAIKQHCPHALKQGVGVQTGTKRDGTPAVQMVDMNVIPEGDVYRLIVNSKLPSAEKFERWVFDEVLPSIRQHGSYGNIDGWVKDIVEQATNAVISEIPAAICQNVFSMLQDFEMSLLEDSLKQGVWTNIPDGEFSGMTVADAADISFWYDIIIEWRKFRGRKARVLADREFVRIMKEKYPDCGISQRGLYRKWKRFKKNGKSGLIDGRGRHCNHRRKDIQ